jgi:hypothetical protein
MKEKYTVREHVLGCISDPVTGSSRFLNIYSAAGPGGGGSGSGSPDQEDPGKIIRIYPDREDPDFNEKKIERASDILAGKHDGEILPGGVESEKGHSYGDPIIDISETWVGRAYKWARDLLRGERE